MPLNKLLCTTDYRHCIEILDMHRQLQHKKNVIRLIHLPTTDADMDMANTTSHNQELSKAQVSGICQAKYSDTADLRHLDCTDQSLFT